MAAQQGLKPDTHQASIELLREQTHPWSQDVKRRAPDVGQGRKEFLVPRFVSLFVDGRTAACSGRI